MRVLTRAVALGSSTRMLWLLQATSSRTRVPCALCHSAASQAPQVPQVRYAELAQTLDSIEQADARLAKEELMAKLLERACREAPSDMTLCVALTSLQLSPGMRPSKLGIGDALILSALSEASGTPVATLKAELTQVGDLGIVSVDNLGEPPAGGAPLTLSEVHATLLALAGEGLIDVAKCAAAKTLFFGYLGSVAAAAHLAAAPNAFDELKAAMEAQN